MKKVLGVALGAGILLTACGSNGSPAANEKEVKFGEIMNKGKQISYKVKNYDGEQAPTKNSEIKYIIKTNNGKVTAYNVQDEIELKDIKDKSDKEIIDLAKKQDKKYMLNAKDETIGKIKDSIKSIKDYDNLDELDKDTKESYIEQLNDDEKMLKELNNYKYSEPKERKLKIKAVEDGTGNYTDEERFFIVPHDIEMSETGKAYNDYANTYTKFDSGAGTMKIYDTNYAFLERTEENSEDEQFFLVTPVSKKTEFSKLDKPNSKYVKAVDEDE
ncbi:hypothetical protein BL313_02315 [Staphylococcus hominis]|uniref:hypothetical protein n=1 Tax=Staphylococcus hominis TaxID=1290 RepID=UPI0009001498|nr:hypothetical protein [Staphylococcus hominis]OJH01853.1 hypothetical protein BL313_02315 [Staphylococcus hominis]